MIVASCSALETFPTRIRPASPWRRFLSTLIEGPTWTVHDKVAEYLERNEHDLSPQVRTLLERRAI